MEVTPQEQAEVDAVTRAILYPWVREALELLVVLRDDLTDDLKLPPNIGDPPAMAVGHLRAARLYRRIEHIDHIIDQATGRT